MKKLMLVLSLLLVTSGGVANAATGFVCNLSELKTELRQLSSGVFQFRIDRIDGQSIGSNIPELSDWVGLMIFFKSGECQGTYCRAETKPPYNFYAWNSAGESLNIDALTYAQVLASSRFHFAAKISVSGKEISVNQFVDGIQNKCVSP